MQARRFILGGEVVALAFGSHQQRSHAGFAGREHAQLDSSACQPGNILIAANEHAAEFLRAHPFHQLFVLRLEFRIPCGLLNESDTVNGQVPGDSGGHDCSQ